MDPIAFLQQIKDRNVQILITVVLIVIWVVMVRISSTFIKKFGKRHEISLPRAIYTVKYFRFVLFVFFLLLFGLIWDVSFKGLSVYFLSFFTVAGIGLFAAWSILSNITAAIILFFYFPYKIGDRIRIMDGDNSVEGIVFDLNMFSMIIKNDEGNKVTYPNNLALQKAIILIKE